MTLQLWQHRNGARYIVLLHDGVVMFADGPLSADEIAAAQADENTIQWSTRTADLVEARRNEYTQVWPVTAEATR